MFYKPAESFFRGLFMVTIISFFVSISLYLTVFLSSLQFLYKGICPRNYSLRVPSPISVPVLVLLIEATQYPTYLQ